MTRDEDFAIQTELIQDISKAAYDAVSSQTKPSSRQERPPGRPWVIMGDFAHLRAITE
ncbi:MAG: hypothetical protein HYX59_01805 [Elusimicrobia bacterium]|nr:hypothetical protein [Elusimicrobiota bacterium]